MSLDVLFRQPFAGDRLLHRQVVRVADPADGVGVLAVARRELGRTPARDRLTHELLRCHQRPEADEDDDGVLSVQSVDIIVIHTKLDLADRQNRLEKSLHVCGRCVIRTGRSQDDEKTIRSPLVYARSEPLTGHCSLYRLCTQRSVHQIG